MEDRTPRELAGELIKLENLLKLLEEESPLRLQVSDLFNLVKIMSEDDDFNIKKRTILIEAVQATTMLVANINNFEEITKYSSKLNDIGEGVYKDFSILKDPDSLSLAANLIGLSGMGLMIAGGCLAITALAFGGPIGFLAAVLIMAPRNSFI